MPMPPTFMKTLLEIFPPYSDSSNFNSFYSLLSSRTADQQQKEVTGQEVRIHVCLHFKSELTQMSLCSLQRIKKLVPSYSHHDICCNNNLII